MLHLTDLNRSKVKYEQLGDYGMGPKYNVNNKVSITLGIYLCKIQQL